MNVSEVLRLVLSILSGIAICIPLTIKLIDAIKALVKERNWSKIVDETMQYMAIAKEKFENNADKKEWVMAMVAHSAKALRYDVDMDAISNLIDSVCDVSKILRDTKG